MARATRKRNWCFTLNNYTPEDRLYLSELKDAEIVFQEETGESGTPHLQGVIFFKNARTLQGMKRIHNGIHWESMKGTKAQAIAYCTKEETRTGGIFANFDYTGTVAQQKIKKKKMDPEDAYAIMAEMARRSRFICDDMKWDIESKMLCAKGEFENKKF